MDCAAAAAAVRDTGDAGVKAAAPAAAPAVSSGTIAGLEPKRRSTERAREDQKLADTKATTRTVADSTLLLVEHSGELHTLIRPPTNTTRNTSP
jgi:hypothetical protein